MGEGLRLADLGLTPALCLTNWVTFGKLLTFSSSTTNSYLVGLLGELQGLT